MTVQSEAWRNILQLHEDRLSDSDLDVALVEAYDAINCLVKINDGRFDEQINSLTYWSKKIEKIKQDRRDVKRPKLGTRIDLNFKDDSLTFYGLPDGPWGVRAGEETERLRKLLDEVYGKTKSMRVEL